MKKINFIGQKDSGKSLSCFLLSQILSSTYKVLLLNFDFFSKYKDFLKKSNLKTKNVVIKITNNFHLINVKLTNKNDKQAIENELNTLFNSLKNKYDLLMVDQPISFGEVNINLLNNSDLIICPFKIDYDILNYQKKILDSFIKNNIVFKNFRYLPILTNDKNFNASQIVKIRKNLLGLIFDKTIGYYYFNDYDDLLKNEALLNEYEQISLNIKKII